MLEGVWEAGIGLCGLRAEVLGRELTPFHFHLISILFIEVGLTKFRGLLFPSPTQTHSPFFSTWALFTSQPSHYHCRLWLSSLIDISLLLTSTIGLWHASVYS